VWNDGVSWWDYLGRFGSINFGPGFGVNPGQWPGPTGSNQSAPSVDLSTFTAAELGLVLSSDNSPMSANIVYDKADELSICSLGEGETEELTATSVLMDTTNGVFGALLVGHLSAELTGTYTMGENCAWEFIGIADPQDFNTFDFHDNGLNGKKYGKVLGWLGRVVNPVTSRLAVEITGTIEIDGLARCDEE
jgi:hypothetical protein